MNTWRRGIYPSAFLVALLAGDGFAQTSQPARVSWPDVIAQLAEALVEPRSDDAVRAFIPDDALIRRFDHSDYDDRLALRNATSGLTVVATHGYLGVPNSIATDLAVDFRNASQVPEELKDQMIPSDESAAKRANVTAGQWVTGTLEPQKAQPVGIIVLLRRDTASLGASERFSLVFVLVKGESSGAGQFRVTHIAYGDTHHIVRQ